MNQAVRCLAFSVVLRWSLKPERLSFIPYTD
jgi:hypothetical protein